MPSTLNDDVLSSIDRSVLCWLATASADGIPNVSPKEIFTTYKQQTVLVANIASPNSVQNTRDNSQVCLSFVDVFVQKGYKLQGTAKIVLPTESSYAALEVPLAKLTGGIFPIKSIIAIQITAIAPHQHSPHIHHAYAVSL